MLLYVVIWELSLLLERDELPFFLPVLTFSPERNLQTMLCCLLLPDWMWLRLFVAFWGLICALGIQSHFRVGSGMLVL